MIFDPPFLRPDNHTGKYLSLGLTVLVHVLLAVILFYGVRWQTKRTDVIEVELVRAAVSPAPTFQPAPKIQPEPAPKPVTETPPALPPKKPDIAIKEKVKEAPKPKPQPEPKPVVEPKPDTPPRKTSFLDQLQKEADQLLQRKKIDAATEALDKEKATREAASRNTAMADYLSRIRGKIRGNIVLPPDVKGNPEAVFDVTQLPSGEIVTARLRRSSGNAALDAAIERAILKSNPLPKPEKNDLFSRTLELSFRPLEE
ncbi:MAG: TonB C-terminal domain-containing protein [Stagnimonas sp.]|nr:TonB C-terminal domain-containing protein [Stagnimonas sp.]